LGVLDVVRNLTGDCFGCDGLICILVAVHDELFVLV